MSYRILPPEPGGRRDRRLRSQARARTMQHVAVSVALVSFATGTFVSEGVEGLRGAYDDAAAHLGAVVAPVSAAEATVEVVSESVEEEIPFTSERTADFKARDGSLRVVQEGVPGVELVTYTVTYVDGVETERNGGVRVQVIAPVPEIVAVGQLVIPPATDAEKGTNREIGQRLANELYGWSGDEWACLDELWRRESGWSHTAGNKSSGAYGIPQALPGSKMATFGADWLTNPETQIKWGLSYVSGRYGTPCGAWAHFTAKNWY